MQNFMHRLSLDVLIIGTFLITSISQSNVKGIFTATLLDLSINAILYN